MISSQEQRHIYYDQDLQIEAYQLIGVIQKFPNHFHEYYVIGFVEGGKRHLYSKNKKYDISKGDLILFNPHDNHCCSPLNGEVLDYRAININPEIMYKLVKEITGKKLIPHFTETVVYQSDIAQSIKSLYSSIVSSSQKQEKEEALFFLLEQLLHEHTIFFDKEDLSNSNEQIKSLCNYMEVNFMKNISLDDLLSMTTFSKSYLLRYFTKEVGVSPYRYLQTVRLNKAKKLLEKGIPPIEIADMTGFSDQSHFTNFFKEFIGLTPKQYQRIFIDVEKPYTPIKRWQNDK